jgi:hypothetical protein
MTFIFQCSINDTNMPDNLYADSAEDGGQGTSLWSRQADAQKGNTSHKNYHNFVTIVTFYASFF